MNFSKLLRSESFDEPSNNLSNCSQSLSLLMFSVWLLVKTVVLDLKLRVKKITRVKNKMVTVNNVYSLAIMQKLSYWWGGFHTWILGILVSYNFFIFSYSINFLKNSSMLLLFNFPYFSIVFFSGQGSISASWVTYTLVIQLFSFSLFCPSKMANSLCFKHVIHQFLLLTSESAI